MLEGAPLNTFDLDIVHSREPGNIERLLAALEDMGGSAGSLTTRFGTCDILGAIGRSRSYDDLLPHTVELEVADGLRVRVLDLETLIRTKEETGGEKDLAVLPVLRQTLKEKRRRARVSD